MWNLYVYIYKMKGFYSVLFPDPQSMNTYRQNQPFGTEQSQSGL